VQTSPWAQELSEGGGLMGYAAREEMAKRETETGLIPQRGMLESEQIGASRRLLPKQEALAGTQLTGKKGLAEGLPDRGIYSDLGKKYSSTIEREEGMQSVGQYLQKTGNFRSGLLPELGMRESARIDERNEAKRRAELERSRALGYS